MLTTTYRRSSARREFLSSFGARQFCSQKTQKLSRSHGHTPLGRAHSNHAIIGVKGTLGPIDKNHQSPLTPMMDRFAWVVVLAPNEGCGRENREEEKGRKGEERVGRGVQFQYQTKRGKLQPNVTKMG